MRSFAKYIVPFMAASGLLGYAGCQVYQSAVSADKERKERQERIWRDQVIESTLYLERPPWKDEPFQPFQIRKDEPSSKE